MKAFIVHQGKVLILREASAYNDGSHYGKYDVAGGRVKPGQHFKESLLREIEEETGIEELTIGRPFCVHEWRPVVKGEPWHIVATFFECSADSSEIKLSEDHDHFQWIDPQHYKEANVIENLYPAFEAYLETKNRF